MNLNVIRRSKRATASVSKEEANAWGYVDEIWDKLLSLPEGELRKLEEEFSEHYFFGTGRRDSWMLNYLSVLKRPKSHLCG